MHGSSAIGIVIHFTHEQVISALIAVIALALLFLGHVDTRRRDRRRIRRYLERMGARPLTIKRRHILPGWLSGDRRRGYQVRFVDREGRTHEAYCRTATLAGVYFTGDTATHFKVLRVRDDLCRRCGYSLIGNASGVCPECGTAVPADGEDAGGG